MNSEETDSAHVQWLKNKVFNKEHISMRDFATDFKYFSENDTPFLVKFSPIRMS